MTALATDVLLWERPAPDRFVNEAVIRRLNLNVPKRVRLQTLVKRAALMQRTDRKYIAPADTVAELVAAIGDTHRVLSIDGRRYTTYRTHYFDTKDFTSARAHIQGRRQRWKVRSRLYVEDQLCRVEVKTKDNRGNTLKVMSDSDPSRFGKLTRTDRNFVATQLDDFPETNVRDLTSVAEVRYTRATLADLSAGTRITLDWGLSMHLAEGDVWLDDQYVMIETKGPISLGRADRALMDLGVRPRGFSKYVSAAAALRPDIPANDFASLLANNVLHSRTKDL